jgi:hypothetical protein
MERNEPGLSGGRIIRWLTGDAGVALILALAIAAVLLGMRPSITRACDYQLMHQFYKFYLGASIRAGDLPLWNPYVSLGRPFLADMETASLYPPNWVFIVLPEIPALFLFLVFHFWLAGFYFIKLMRDWVVPHDAAVALAVAWLASGPFLGQLEGGGLGYFCGMAYWPLFFHLAECLRTSPHLRYWVALVLGASGCFLSGHPQCFWITAMGLGLYLLGTCLGQPWRQNIRRGLVCLGTLASAFLFALVLCAAQLLPMVDLALQGNRASSSLQFSALGSVNWGTLTTLFISQPIRSNQTWCDSNLHLGVICTLAGLLGLMQWRDARVRGLWLMGGIGFMLALGQQTPLFAMAFHVLPGMEFFRMPERWAGLLPWAFVLAAGIAWADEKQALIKIAPMLIVLMIGIAWVLLGENKFNYSALIIAGLLACLALAALRAASRGGAEIAVIDCRMLLVLLVANSLAAAAHMWAYYQRYIHESHVAEIAEILHGKNLYPANGVPPRLFAPVANSGMKYGFSSVAAYGSLTSMRVWAYLNAGTGLPVDFLQNTCLSYEAYHAGPFPFPGMNIAAGLIYGTSKISFNPQPGQRAWLTYAWEQTPDWAAALQRMTGDHVDPAKLALLEAPAVGPTAAVVNSSHGEVVIDAFHRNSIELHVHSSSPALLIMAEAWYPGWRATVNGMPVEVLPANVWMRAVRVPAGESRVEMHYVEPGLVLGAAISLGALLMLAAIGWRLHQRRGCQ